MSTITKTRTRRVRCREGCNHEPFKNKAGELMHYHRVHSGRILLPSQSKLKSTRTNGNGIHTDVASVEVVKPPPKTQKRKYTRRSHPKPDTGGTNVDILFCPECLTDLTGVGVGMLMAKRSKVNGCPKCGLDFRIVAAGMAMSPKA